MSAGTEQRKLASIMFADYEEAKAHADEIVEKLAQGQADVITLNGHERAVYVRATGLLPAGIGLDQAVRQYVDAMNLLKGASIVEAARAFAAAKEDLIPSIAIGAFPGFLRVPRRPDRLRPGLRRASRRESWAQTLA